MIAGRIDPAACVACGLCERLAPALFRVILHRVAVLRLGPRIPASLEERAWWAAEACPTGAIHLSQVPAGGSEGEC
ncbi:ferredoxin [Caldinitratiruptor microaerophilus]|uniref:Ferredoxin n=1 Tax=Caldinitratiruptor microaerophilus TaxID=671077 RepID=A0AA35G8Z1_9FIRM|nr:ferredoxin [Caldinitratiruptor microaerophilus]BDG61566.1 hypothetical protein caldi_26560 [Caldinitratiruptor microaerophilus]